MNIFENTTRPAGELFFRHYDPNDVRLGAAVPADESAYEAAQVVILGCPQDEGVQRNNGRPGAADAPDAIRRCFYKASIAGLEELRLFDLGNTMIQPALEETHALHRDIVRQILRDSKRLIVLGGGNDISYPDCSALALESESVLGFNVDAHFDVRAVEPRNSGTPYRQLLEENHLKPSHFFEMAYLPMGNAPRYHDYLQAKGVTAYSIDHVREVGVHTMFGGILSEVRADAIFWGLDMDSVKAADAPGVSAVHPLGLTAEEFCQIAGLAGSDHRSRILEITEVNPDYDIDQRTCSLAAAAMLSFLYAMEGLE